MAKAFKINPLLGLAAGSVPLTGGHGTSGAFGPVLEELGVQGASVVAIASAIWTSCWMYYRWIIGRKLLLKHNLKCTESEVNKAAAEEAIANPINEKTIFKAVCLIGIAAGIEFYLSVHQ